MSEESKHRFADRFPVWLAVAALIVGLISTGTSLVLHAQESHSTCRTKQAFGAEVRAYVGDILSDPHVSPAQRVAETQLVLKHFPPVSCQ